MSKPKSTKPRKTSKNRRVVITLPARVLKDVDWLAPLEDMTRDELILKAVKRFLKPHLAIRKDLRKIDREIKQGKMKTYGPFDTVKEMLESMKANIKESRMPKVTKAISESAGRFKTGRYED